MEEIIIKHPNGEIKERYFLDSMGRKVGTYELYHQNGVRMETVTYNADGYKESSKAWYDNGQLQRECNYNATGKRVGLCKEWDEKRKLTKTVFDQDEKAKDKGKVISSLLNILGRSR